MAGARYVVLGLAPPRSPWFRDVGQWANAGAVAAEFVKCVSADEVRARLAGGRAFSALLVDGSLPSLDRDLIHTAADAECAVIVIGGSGSRDWAAAGAAAVLAPVFARKDLIEVLGAHAAMIGRADRAFEGAPLGDGPVWQAPLVAVTGPGGTGASTVAIALAQGLAADVRSAGSVLLADLRLHAEQAMLHDARDVVPGVQELVDAFRSGRPGAEDLRGLTFGIPTRGYRLLLGLRRSRAWATIRPQAFEACVDGLRGAHRMVVADVEPDVEGEDDGGSIDVEERNVMARTACARADAVLVVGLPGMKGLHSMTRVLGGLLAYGVPGARLVAVVNRAPRSIRSRAELTAALAELMPAWAGAGMPSPVFLPDRRVDQALRDGVTLPDVLVAPVVGAVGAVMARATEDARRPQAPRQVRPGSVGSWGAELAGGRQ